MPNLQANNKGLSILTRIVLETIAELPDGGVPSGPVYAALSTVGVTYSAYMDILDSLQWLGYMRQSNNLLFITEQGRKALEVGKPS